MKATINGHVYWHHTKYMAEPEIVFERYDRRGWDAESQDGHVHIAEHSFEFDVPDNFDPRPGLIAGLEAQKQMIRAEFAAKVLEIDKQISQLLAIENAVAA